MGKISDKNSYKNVKSAEKSSRFFTAKQAAKKQSPFPAPPDILDCFKPAGLIRKDKPSGSPGC